MNIRLERPEDNREVENLTREAFWNVYRPGCTEHYVLHCYRSNPDFIPELDLVMEEEGRIIGHVMFSKAEIVLDDGTVFPSWTFGPISIHPDYKRKRYGLELLNHALGKAKAMGIGLLSMEGNIDFYRHAGFGLASKMGIHYHAEPRDAEVPYCTGAYPRLLGQPRRHLLSSQGLLCGRREPRGFRSLRGHLLTERETAPAGTIGNCLTN